MKCIKNIQQALDVLNSNNFLVTDEKKMDTVVISCVEFLESIGFHVRQPLKKTAVTNTQMLVTCYYNSLYNKVPDILPVRDEEKDRTIAKQLVERLKADFDLKTKDALSMAENIIIILLRNWEVYGIDKGLLCSFAVFGQGKLKFITDRTISTLNSSKYNEEVGVALADDWAESYLNENGQQLGYI